MAQETCLVAICLTAVFAVRAILAAPRERCQCFGRWLPSSGLLAQRMRNLVLLLIALVYFGSLYVTQSNLALPVVDAAAGLTMGIAVVLVPWLLEWVLVPNDAVAKYPTR